ncbi:DUF6894 family protein [Microvirga zambiensis]|uniref:DUF6894 family protein n=1 Tax=Microvirga zambiensis TaxID=1402137 RepID=UPI00191F1E6E|nr:hypothetical protein [Microvirga zambiensis]
MRYYFHLVAPDDGILDEVGIEASCPETAKAEALLALQEILADHEDASDGWRGWQLEVTDASLRTVFTIDLDQVPHPECLTARRSAMGNARYVFHSFLAALTYGLVWQNVAPLI